VLQFSVKHDQGIDCGGGYIKILPAGVDQTKFNGDSPYNIMFGPDICGATRRVHAIFNHAGTNKLVKKDVPCETDKQTHVYTLTVNGADLTYSIMVDGEKRQSGTLESGWDFLAPREIPDASVTKPADWVDEAMIADPEDVKPEGYDAIPAKIADPDASKPDDWDEELDGKWEAPTIANPEYKGPWVAKKIPNPAYKGKWEQPKIANPDFKVRTSRLLTKLSVSRSIALARCRLWGVSLKYLFI
jgi:calreticulin